MHLERTCRASMASAASATVGRSPRRKRKKDDSDLSMRNASTSAIAIVWFSKCCAGPICLGENDCAGPPSPCVFDTLQLLSDSICLSCSFCHLTFAFSSEQGRRH
jgi:hypothetical protein